MRNIFTIARRELAAYLTNPMGYIIVAVVLLVDGLLFNVFALGAGRKLSAQVLQDFFYLSSGTTMIAALLLSMRLFAEERQQGTMVLLRTSPISTWEVVLGKFLSAFSYLSVMTLLTIYMPLFILINGQVSFGHLLVGYLGLLGLGAAAVSIGMFASTLTRWQVVAAIISAGILVTLLMCWLLAKISAPPLSTVFAHLSLWNKHFPPFMKGTFHLRDLVYYISVTYFFMLLSVRTLTARRWS